MKYTVYQIKNDVNDRIYVGHTTMPLEKRWSCHKSYATRSYGKSQLYEAMREIGVDHFECESVYETDNPIELKQAEREIILAKGAIEHGYNHNEPAKVESAYETHHKKELQELHEEIEARENTLEAREHTIEELEEANTNIAHQAVDIYEHSQGKSKILWVLGVALIFNGAVSLFSSYL